MEVQEVIVAIIGIVISTLVLYKTYSFFFVKKENKTGCGCSSCGCSTTKKRKIAH